MPALPALLGAVGERPDEEGRWLVGRVEGGLDHAEEGDAVNLLTYFRAKGRQWGTVILPGANQQVIPLAGAPVEDERRPFYVAVTRATSNLVISYVRTAVRCPVEPSQFIAELGLDPAAAEEKGGRYLACHRARWSDTDTCDPRPHESRAGRQNAARLW